MLLLSAWYNLFSTNSSTLRPIPLTVYQATNLIVTDITVLQTPSWNFFVSDSKNVWAPLPPCKITASDVYLVSACLIASTFIQLQRSLEWMPKIQSSHSALPVPQIVPLTFPFVLRTGSGWDIYRSDKVTISNSNITNQDDCVSFKPNSTNVVVKNLICDGSHGISVGDFMLLIPTLAPSWSLFPTGWKSWSMCVLCWFLSLSFIQLTCSM